VQTLITFIRDNRQLILEEWTRAVRRLPSAHGLPPPAIRDHVPELLDLLADAIDRADTSSVPLQGLPNLHAALRLREGYDLRQVVSEYRILRRVIHELYSERGDLADDMRPKMQPLRIMHAALDAAISDAVDQYSVDRDKSREMFISMLGHDLRDPLGAITFGLQGLLDQHSDDIPASAVKTIVRTSVAAKRMERMIRDLLDFARGRLGGGLAVIPAPIDARPLINDTVQELAHAHPDRVVRCLASESPGDFAVHWDGDRVAQAISNLVSNAIFHGQDPIVVEPMDQGERIAIEVRNRGEISRDVLPRLFDPFTHGGTDRRQREAIPRPSDRRRGHLGLGLYIVHEIAEAHGGSVSADSVDGQAVFRLVLPRIASSR